MLCSWANLDTRETLGPAKCAPYPLARGILFHLLSARREGVSRLECKEDRKASGAGLP